MVAFCVASRYDPPCTVLQPVRTGIARKSASIQAKTGQERSDCAHCQCGKDGEMARVIIESTPNPPDAHVIHCRLRYCPAGNSWAIRADRRPNTAGCRSRCAMK